MSLKSRGAPYPLPSDPNDAAGWIDQLAGWVNDRPGIATLTTTQRNAIPPAELWTGRIIFNTTTKRLEFYDAGSNTWSGSIPTPGRILASKDYNANLAATNYSGDEAMSDVLAADLALTFVAPASGRVWVDLEALASWSNPQAANGATGAVAWWALRQGSSPVAYAQMFGEGTRQRARCRGRMLVVGLDAGQTYSWKWAHQATRNNSDNSNTSVTVYALPASPASMMVIEA